MTLTPQRSLRPRPNKSSFLDDDFGFVPISAPPQVEEESEQKNLFPSKEIIPSPEIDEISEEGELFPSKAPEEVINVDNQLKLYPNPTKDIVNIKIQPQILSKTESIKLYNTNSSLVKILKINNPNLSLEVDLTDKPTGVYFLHIHMNDGSKSITKKIIKN